MPFVYVKHGGEFLFPFYSK